MLGRLCQTSSPPTQGWGSWLVCCAWVLASVGLGLGSAGASSIGSSRDFAVTVRLLDGDRNPLPDAGYTGEVTILMPFVAGRLFGEMSSEGAIKKRVRVGDVLRFAAEALQRPLERAAKVWNGAEASTWSIAPSAARIVRLATLSLRPDGEPFADQTLLLDADTKDGLLLLYVDRACSIRGTTPTGTGTADLAIELPAPGFHWIRVRNLEKGRQRLTYEAQVEQAWLGLQVISRAKD